MNAQSLVSGFFIQHLAALGAGGCRNVHVRDLQFVGLRKLEAKDHASQPAFVWHQVEATNVVPVPASAFEALFKDRCDARFRPIAAVVD